MEFQYACRLGGQRLYCKTTLLNKHVANVAIGPEIKDQERNEMKRKLILPRNPKAIGPYCYKGIDPGIDQEQVPRL